MVFKKPGQEEGSDEEEEDGSDEPQEMATEAEQQILTNGPLVPVAPVVIINNITIVDED